MVYETKDYNHQGLTPLDYTDRLQFVRHEEGRMRPKADNSSFEYDCMIKDHLANVRMVITEEQQTDGYPAATMETASITNESKYYGGLTATQDNRPTWFADPLYSTNNKVARLKNASGSQKIGPIRYLK